MINMKKEYQVSRKLQEQSGSYFVFLPKLWVNSYDLKQGDLMSVSFNGDVKIKPPNSSRTITLQPAGKKKNENTDSVSPCPILAKKEVRNVE